MSVLDSFTEGILIMAGGFLGGCMATITLILINIRKKKNITTKLDSIL